MLGGMGGRMKHPGLYWQRWLAPDVVHCRVVATHGVFAAPFHAAQSNGS
jgi:hypothetical protein